MLDLVKKFKTFVPEAVQIVLICVIGVYALAFGINYNVSFFSVLIALLPVLLVVGSAVLLSLFKKQLAAHVTLLFGLFINALFVFVRALFSLNFSPLSYTPGFTAKMFVDLIVFVYLALIVVSYIIAEGLPKASFKNNVFYVTLLAFAFLWIFNGFNAALFSVLLTLSVLWFGLKFPAVLLLLRLFIAQPFVFINNAINGTLGFYDFGDYIYLLGALGLITICSMLIYQMITTKKLAE